MALAALIGLASRLLPVASVVPDVVRAFGGDRQADAAEKMVGIAKAITGKTGDEDAVESIIRDPALQLQYQQALINERVKFKEMEYADKQSAHEQQQKTIRTGDTSQDEYVRHTRPLLARQSWYSTWIYVIGFEAAELFKYGTGADWEIALVLLSPAAAYLGFRTGDKFANAWTQRAKR